MDIESQTGDEVQALVEKIYRTSPEILAYLRKGATQTQ